MKAMLLFAALCFGSLLSADTSRLPSLGSRAQAAERKAPVPRLSKKQRQRLFRQLATASERGNLAAVKALIRSGAEVNGREEDDGFLPRNRPIVGAAAKGHLPVVEALLAAGADPNSCCCSCITSLHKAIIGRHVQVVRRLLEAGADPRLIYDSTTATIELARKSGDPAIVALIEGRLRELEKSKDKAPAR